jgi:hypothetical protein
LTPKLNTDGEALAPGYVMELPDQGSADLTLTAQAWQELKKLHDDDPAAFTKMMQALGSAAADEGSNDLHHLDDEGSERAGLIARTRSGRNTS